MNASGHVPAGPQFWEDTTITKTRVSFWRLKSLKSRAQHLLLQASGHCCTLQPTIGYLDAGGIGRVPITRIRFGHGEFTQGPAMIVTALADASMTGAVGGRFAVCGPDGAECWRSPVKRPGAYFGVKTRGSTWEITVDCDLEPPSGWVTDERAERAFQVQLNPLLPPGKG